MSLHIDLPSFCPGCFANTAIGEPHSTKCWYVNTSNAVTVIPQAMDYSKVRASYGNHCPRCHALMAQFDRGDGFTVWRCAGSHYEVLERGAER